MIKRLCNPKLDYAMFETLQRRRHRSKYKDSEHQEVPGRRFGPWGLSFKFLDAQDCKNTSANHGVL